MRNDVGIPDTFIAPTRRTLLLCAGAHLLLTTGAMSQPAPSRGGEAARPAAGPWFFLTSREGETLTALVDRIIPKDEFPSASEAGVVSFFDFQCATAWGEGDGLFMQGPHRTGKPQQGYQLPYTPAEFYRRALAHPALADFAAMPVQQQDALLGRLEKDEQALDDIPGRTFFTQLRQHTIDGYFSDPIHGGNRDMVGWRMIGFPGAHAYYLTEVDRPDLEYRRPPSGVGHRPPPIAGPDARGVPPGAVMDRRP